MGPKLVSADQCRRGFSADDLGVSLDGLSPAKGKRSTSTRGWRVNPSRRERRVNDELMTRCVVVEGL